MKKTLEKIAQEDGRFSPQAIKFVYEGLAYTAKNIVTDQRHVTGQALCDGLKNLAIEKWGRLALTVLNSWNVKNTRDFGEIVYLMIENNLMSTQPTDSIDDFNDVYDFNTIFKDNFEF